MVEQMLYKIVEVGFAAEYLVKVKVNADAVVVAIRVEMLVGMQKGPNWLHKEIVLFLEMLIDAKPLLDSYCQNLSKS